MGRVGVAVLASVLGVGGVLTRSIAPARIAGWETGYIPSWVPMLRSIGHTGLFYRAWLEALGPVVLVGVAMWIGYEMRPKDGLGENYLEFLGTVLAASTVGALATWLSVTVSSELLGSLDPFEGIVMAALLLEQFGTIALVVTVGAFAGAAIGEFRATGSEPQGRRAPADGERGTVEAVNP